MVDSDTIAAISTPPGEGGIAIIRVSGPQSVQAVENIFAAKRKLGEVPSHTVHYGHIREAKSGLRIEEALVTVMRAPKSFTAEDVVEIGCHGGIVSVRKVLGLLFDGGIVRPAEPGEFTKRAFLNGRIDLSQAEAVIDLIRSKSDRAHAIALRQAEGALSGSIRNLRQRLVELMAHIEVNIDYPEHDVAELTGRLIRDRCLEAIAEIDRLLKSASQGKILREGITTVIVGRPNVGKSSLLNALARENRAIVTEIPGTTRDVIEQFVTIGDVPLRLLDTAGIRETSDIVERIGVERSRSAMSDADLVLFVLNYHEPLHEEEMRLLGQLRDRKTIVIVNKTDLPGHLNVDELRERFAVRHLVHMSVKRQQGLPELEQAISDIFFGGGLEMGDTAMVSNVRHIHLLKRARSALEEASAAAEAKMPIDMIQIDLHVAWEQLGEIVGDTVNESLLDQIFAQFCLGK